MRKRSVQIEPKIAQFRLKVVEEGYDVIIAQMAKVFLCIVGFDMGRVNQTKPVKQMLS